MSAFVNRTLLAKELNPLFLEACFAGVFAAGALALFGEAVLSYGVPTSRAGDGLSGFAFGALATGFSLGAWQIEVERREQTESVLQLRSTAVDGALRAKIAAAWISLFTLGLLSIGLHALFVRVFTAQGGGAEWSRIVDHAALGSLAFSAHAVAMWASHLPRKGVLRVVAGIAAALGLFALSGVIAHRSSEYDGSRAPLFVALQVAVTAIALVSAHRLARARTEAERPLPPALALAQIPLGIALIGTPTWMAATSVQNSLQRDLGATRVALVRDVNGHIEPVLREGGRLFRMDADGRPTGSALHVGMRAVDGELGAAPWEWAYDATSTPLEWAVDAPQPLQRRFRGQKFDLGPARMLLIGRDAARPMAWFDQSTRRLHVLRWDGDRAVERRVLGKGPTQAAFSRESWPIFGDDALSVAWFDASDATLWRLSPASEGGWPSLEPAPLPDGAQPTGVERVHWAARVRLGLNEPYGVSDSLVLRSPGAIWDWSDFGWRPFQADAQSILESERLARIEHRLRRANSDGLQPMVELVDARDGSVAASVAEPLRGSRRWLGVATCAMSLMRPPIVAAWAHTRPIRDLDAPRERSDAFVRDVALFGGPRAWLVGLSFALSFGLAWITLRQLGQSARDRGLTRVWVVAVALLGMPAIAAMGLLEPARSRSGGPAER